jgi:hypothetical protein
MTSEDEFDRIISQMQSEQRIRDNASSLYAAVIFCKGHLQETNWASEESRLDSLDMAMRLCEVVLDRANGVIA